MELSPNPQGPPAPEDEALCSLGGREHAQLPQGFRKLFQEHGLRDVLMGSPEVSGIQVSSVQPLSHVRLFATPWTTAQQSSLSITNSRSPPKPISTESVMLPGFRSNPTSTAGCLAPVSISRAPRVLCWAGPVPQTCARQGPAKPPW